VRVHKSENPNPGKWPGFFFVEKPKFQNMETHSESALRVAIQGVPGSFHDIAARRHFAPRAIALVACATFDEVFKALDNDQADLGVLAVENSQAGSLLQNYVRLQESRYAVLGEHYLRVKQNLLGHPGQRVEEIREVYSHPIAIMQCREFFKQFPWVKLVDSYDTAQSAKDVATKHGPGTAAIGSELAAELYGLEVLAEGIETNKRNYTRFLVIGRGDVLPETSAHLIDKASIGFSLEHKTGRLSQVLSVLAFYDMNLTKIQSLPLVGEAWTYFFHVDLTFEDFARYQLAIKAIQPLTKDLQVLGEYRAGLDSLD